MEEGNLALEKRYTYADYASWGDDTRWELIDGVPYAMSAPSEMHQRIVSRLCGQFYAYLRGKKTCEVYVAPFDVRLNYYKGDDTVIQPDIVVVCDNTKRHAGGCLGAPDLVVEILSPSTAKMDRIVKFNKYMRDGVKEYWVVDPDTESLHVHLLKEGTYYATSAYEDTDTVSVGILPGCEINLADVFEPMV